MSSLGGGAARDPTKERRSFGLSQRRRSGRGHGAGGYFIGNGGTLRVHRLEAREVVGFGSRAVVRVASKTTALQDRTNVERVRRRGAYARGGRQTRTRRAG
jgi:hypothetical protein